MKQMKNILLLGLLSVFFLSGCSSIKVLNSNDPEYLTVTEYKPVEDKAVLYIYRSKISDFQGMVTSVDIGPKELDIFSNSVHRFEIPADLYDMEPNGIGMFAIEEELELQMDAGEVYFVELRHTSRFGIPNKHQLLEKTRDELDKVIASDQLLIVPIERL